jgi:hypothetical protein
MSKRNLIERRCRVLQHPSFSGTNIWGFWGYLVAD